MKKTVIIVSVLMLIAGTYWAQNTKDTVVITIEIEGISLEFSEKEYHEIIYEYSELINNIVYHPDIYFHKYAYKNEFTSEKNKIPIIFCALIC